jgi:hypothetical protein
MSNIQQLAETNVKHIHIRLMASFTAPQAGSVASIVPALIARFEITTGETGPGRGSD